MVDEQIAVRESKRPGRGDPRKGGPTEKLVTSIPGG